MNTLEIASRSPLVSVIMPAFNHDRYMGEALDSVGAQALEDIETDPIHWSNGWCAPKCPPQP